MGEQMMFPHISDDIEKDVWYYSKEFGLNRTQFRMIMAVQEVGDYIHHLSYGKVSASDLIAVLESNQSILPKRAVDGCIKRLRKAIESESISDFYTES